MILSFKCQREADSLKVEETYEIIAACRDQEKNLFASRLARDRLIIWRCQLFLLLIVRR
jgi:hypothetical protein